MVPEDSSNNVGLPIKSSRMTGMMSSLKTLSMGQGGGGAKMYNI